MTNSINTNGCSTCKTGKENYTTFRHGGKSYYQYDYRDQNGELFSCVELTLDACREKRDNWLKAKAPQVKEYAVKMENGKINEFDTHDEMMAFVNETGWNRIKKCGKSKYFNELNGEE